MRGRFPIRLDCENRFRFPAAAAFADVPALHFSPVEDRLIKIDLGDRDFAKWFRRRECALARRTTSRAADSILKTKPPTAPYPTWDSTSVKIGRLVTSEMASSALCGVCTTPAPSMKIAV